MLIRPYDAGDERGWVRCRALAFLDTAYFDSVEREKERYVRPAIELVAAEAGEIVGLLDVECEETPGTVCSGRPGLGGMIWHVAVHPDHRRRGIGRALVAEAERLARARDLARFEAWTRDDAWVLAWYERLGFERVESYLHVYIERDGGGALQSTIEALKPARTLAHYTGGDREAIRRRFERVHDCNLLELRFA